MKGPRECFNIMQNLFLIVPFILVLLTPFVVDNDLVNGVITGKYFYFYIIMGAMVFISPLLLKRSYIKITILDVVILLFYTGGVIVSLYNMGYANTKLVLFSLLFVLFICCRLVLSLSGGYRDILLIVLLVVGGGEAIIGLFQLYGFSTSHHTLFRVTGTFFNPGPYAGYLSLTAPIALYYLLKEYRVFRLMPDRRLILFYLRFTLSTFTFVSILLILPSSMSRASWISLLGSCIFIATVLFVSREQIFKVIKKQRIKTLTISFFCIIIFSGLCISAYYLKKDSADGRLLMWKVSALTIVKNPMGVGLGGFAGAYGEVQAQYFNKTERSTIEQLLADSPDYAFNEYLQMCIEFGIIPFTLFLFIVTYSISKGLKKRRYPEMGALVSLLIFALMSYPFNILPFLIVFVFLLTSCVSEPNKLLGSNLSIKYILGINLALIIGICLYDRYPTYDAYAKWKNTRYIYDMKLYEKSTEEYRELYPYLKDQPDFLFEYGQSLSQAGYWETSNEVMMQATKLSCDPMFYNIIAKNYQNLGDYGQSEKYLIRSSQIVPNRIYPYYLLAKLYFEWGKYEEAKQTANIVITKSPKVHTKAIDEMRTEMKDLINIEL